MKTRVVNKYKEDYDVYIGRGSGFGNHFIIGRDGNRDQVCDKYEKYFYKRIERDPIFKKSVEDLKGKRLGCFCKPRRCHGDIIVKYLEE